MLEVVSTPGPSGRVPLSIFKNPPEIGAILDETYKLGAIAEASASKLVQPGHLLFLSILQTLTLPPQLRKKVEIASRTYMKAPAKYRNPSKIDEMHISKVLFYKKFLEQAQEHLRVAKEAIAVGKSHAEEGQSDGAEATKIKVGDFTLINTGGLSSKIMGNVQEVIEKAQTLIRSAGLGQVCYGNILVTNTLHKANVLAFYLVAKDELFVRANFKSDRDILHHTIHELGHRYQHKFLRNDILSLYRIIGRHEVDRKRVLEKTSTPQAGETLTQGSDTYEVVRVREGRNGKEVVLKKIGSPSISEAHISLEGYLQKKGKPREVEVDAPDYKGYVTDYAKETPEENFAEMFAFYCMKRLPASQKDLFEEVLAGKKLQYP
jgi:hypothetical protein